MPRNDYRCSSCGHEEEKLTRAGKEPLRDCPECGALGALEVVFRQAPSGRVKGGTPTFHRR